MKNTRPLLLSPSIVLLATGLLFNCFCAEKATKTPASTKMNLVWSDEFKYNGLPDTTKWAYDIGGHGWGNQELQYYTNRLENARADGEKLIIEA
ncbi:MAG TPA: glycoside hydrolase family 16 protein, partial [Saprospiraceae bacterium]|nr:glycoside hydrolase family 16 protein [Saprospiraceae bacterium]